MGRKPNDGRGRIGGRAKGTPNKPKPPVTGWVGEMYNHVRGHAEYVLNRQTDAQYYPRLLSAIIVAEAVAELTATLRELAAASGVNLNPAREQTTPAV